MGTFVAKVSGIGAVQKGFIRKQLFERSAGSWSCAGPRRRRLGNITLRKINVNKLTQILQSVFDRFLINQKTLQWKRRNEPLAVET